MPSKPLFSGRILVALLVAVSIAACGGGGGGSSSSTQPPSPSSIGGVTMLGPVANADVEVSGTSGVLGSGTTGADGSFGPISYSGSYSGPLRVSVTGNAESTWICDFQFGCPAGGNIFQPGQSIVFDGTLEAVVPSANDGQFVSVSLLSNFVAERVDVLGNLSAANVNSANADIANTIRSVLGDTFNDMALALPDDFSSIELFDLQNVPAPGGADDALSMLLTFLNSALMGLADPLQTTGQFIDLISNDVAMQPALPISRRNFFDASQESLLTVFLVQTIEFFNLGGPVLDSINALLLPVDLNFVINSAFNTFIAMPALSLGTFDLDVFVDDLALQGAIFRELEVFTNTGAQLQPGDYDVEVFPVDGGNWLSASAVSIGGIPHVRLDFDNALIATLPNGSYLAGVETYSTSGDFRRHGMNVWLNLSIVGTQVDAGFDITADERSTVVLSGSTNSPNDVATINWVQTSGPAVTITNGDTFQPSVIMPSLDTDQTATLRLDVDFTTGESRSDFVDINITAFPNIADVSLADAILQQCIDDAAAAGNLVDVAELTTLSCAGVSDVTGLDIFSGITSLDLAGNTLSSLQAILALNGLQFLDISGNPSLPCDEIDILAQRLVDGTELIVDDTCQGSVALDLGASGFDAALDEVRNQIYVSIPNRNEIAVISLTGQRIVDRLLMPGTPYGIDVSFDGTRLFAALNGSNAVAVVDIDQRTVNTIDLGVSTDHPTTYDVVEGEPDRLFVSANPGSSGFAYIAQVRLDQGNIASRVANQTIIRARPVLARSPDQQFVYVGAGFSPNSLYKLSLPDPDAPIVLEDDHGSVSGTDNLALNSTGTRIALGSGQVLRTGSFIEEGRVSIGRSVASDVADTLFVAGPNGLIESFDFTTLELADSMTTSCDNGTTSRILAYDSDQSFMLLQLDSVCLHAIVSRTTPPDPFAALRFPDLALEQCVIDAATTFGYTQPEEFTELDCSATAKTILSLDGIDRLSNLQMLDLSNSGVIDLSPLASMTSLQSLVVRNANISDIGALFSISTLTSVDLTGNPGVTCTDLDQLVATGVAVQADQCTDTVRVELGGIGHDMEYDAVGNRVFVSVPSLNQISEVSLNTASIVQNFTLSGQPRGIDLSSDMQTIYAALNGLGDIAVVDSTTGGVEVIDISTELDDDRTWDIAEVSTDRVVVSTNPGSNGLGYIVEVRRDLGNAATRVANNTIIRASPIFAVSPDQTAVYVGAGFSPNSLYKLDATQSNLPIILEDDHGEVSGTASLALNPDGSRIYLLFGQVLSTDTFTQVAQFPAGRSIVSQDGTKLFVGDEQTDSARIYDITTTGQVGNRRWGCDLLTLTVLQEFGDGVLVLGDDLVCYSRTVPYP
jgi:Leucine-rich repeat (LRR) protein